MTMNPTVLPATATAAVTTAASSTSSASPGAPGRPGAPTGPSWLGHPRGLAVLCATEFWERFGYYGLRALLALYLVAPAAHGGLGFTAAGAVAVYGAFLSLGYLLTVPGGWVADRVLGPRRAVFHGSLVAAAGYFLLLAPGTIPFFGGLALVAAGTGLVKAGTSAMVGHLYDGAGPERDRTGADSRRSAGFTAFYIAINLGAFAAPLAIGTLGQRCGFRLGFAVMGVALLAGLAHFHRGRRDLAPHSDTAPCGVDRETLRRLLRRTAAVGTAVCAGYGTLALTVGLTYVWFVVPLTVAGILYPVLALRRYATDPRPGTAQRARMAGFIWLFAGAAVFWMMFDQGGSTLNLYAAYHTTPVVLGFEFPVSWLQALDPLFVMLLGPVFAWGWRRLARRGKEPSAATKFSAGLLLIGLSFVVFLAIEKTAAHGAEVNALWLVPVYFLQSVGDLCLNPVGLSVTASIAPGAHGGRMMGLWYLAAAPGDSAAALAATAGFSPAGTHFVRWEVCATLVMGLLLLLRRRSIAARLGGAGGASPTPRGPIG